MPEISTLAVFLVTAVLLIITPGPAVMYVVARSIDQGRLAGIVSTLGIGVGTLFHVAAAALGVSALLVSSALAFNLVKYLGAIYLIYLGVRKIMAREEINRPKTVKPAALSHVFYQGVVVNILNPKTALFFFAFLPQFVDMRHGSVALQIFFLGTVFVLIGIVSDGLWALLAGTLGQWLKGNLKFLLAQRYFAGTVFIALGITTAMSGSHKK
ncbi:MAG: LysE family translocator [Anaerolineales bacterium]|nr:LysE family translocator [Anaerolineales bacterium]